MSEILNRWRAGEGLPGCLVLDGHTHFGAWGAGANFESVPSAAAGCVAAMDANGIDAACVLGGGFFSSGQDYTLGNDALLELLRLVPDRLIGFAHVNPNDPVGKVLAELDRVHRHGLRCIKLINSYQQRYPGDGPVLMEVYHFAAERRMPVLNHSWSVEEMEKIAPMFPGVDFIFGHYGGAQDAVLKRFANVYANIWNMGPLGFLERGIRNVAPEKFVYGSDTFMNPASVGIGLVVYADIPDGYKRLILGQTMARLLDKAGALPPAIREKYRGFAGV